MYKIEPTCVFSQQLLLPLPLHDFVLTKIILTLPEPLLKNTLKQPQANLKQNLCPGSLTQRFEFYFGFMIFFKFKFKPCTIQF